MRSVDGTRGTQPGHDAARSSKEPEQGAFDRVLDRRGGEGEGGAAGAGAKADGGATTVTARAVQARGEGGEGSGQGGEGQGGGGQAGVGAAFVDLLAPKPSSRSFGAGSVQLGGLGPAAMASAALPPAGTPMGIRANLAADASQGGESTQRRVALTGVGEGGTDRKSKLEDTAGDEAAGAAAAAAELGGTIGRAAVPADIVVAPAVDANALRALAEKVATAMELHLVGQRREVSIGLDLGTLGAGSVTIQRGENGASIVFQLANDQSASFLAERLPQLEQALADRGIAVARLEASAPGGEAPRMEAPRLAGGEQGARDHSGQERRRGDGEGQGDGRSRGWVETVSPEDEG